MLLYEGTRGIVPPLWMLPRDATLFVICCNCCLLIRKHLGICFEDTVLI